MIARISGKIIEKGNNYLIIEVGGISYEVMVPAAVMQRLQDLPGGQNTVSLITYHYLQAEPSKSIPVLVGFLNEVEKEFFETFITVSGIGPRAALKALNKPISLIARAIDEADITFLRSLPGIGEQRAKEIIAKLQNKVGKFGLVRDDRMGQREEKAGDIMEEAIAVLMQLEYKKSEALTMVKKALEKSPDIKNTEELLNAVYKQRKTR
jgi:Holliday junction DNA helicase RuvA